jgi:hypothetical protein
VGPRTALDDVEMRKISPLPGLKLRPLVRPARSQSLYRLRYPGSITCYLVIIKSHLSRFAFTCLIESWYKSVFFIHGHSTAHISLHYSIYTVSHVFLQILHAKDDHYLIPNFHRRQARLSFFPYFLIYGKVLNRLTE